MRLSQGASLAGTFISVDNVEARTPQHCIQLDRDQ